MAVPGPGATCDDFQKALNGVRELQALVYPPDLLGLGPQLAAKAQEILAAAAAAGCVLEDKPVGLVEAAVAGLIRVIQASVTAAATGLAGMLDLLEPVVRTLAGILKTFLAQAGFATEAGMIDDSGSLVGFFASVEDAVIREDLLTSGPLSFQDVLKYEDQISGKQYILILISKAYSMAIEAVSLGQMDTQAGFILHLVDAMIGDTAAQVSRILVRKAVGDAFEAGYSRIHRHKELPAGEAEEAYAIGLIDDARLVDALVGQSFTDAAIQEKVELARIRRENQAGRFPIRTKFVSPSVLISAFKADAITDEELLKELARQGYDDFALAVYWNLALLKKAPTTEGVS